MHFRKAGNLLTEIVYKIAGFKYYDFLTLLLHWNDVVGPLLATHSRVLKIEKKSAFIIVDNNVWMQELMLNKKMLIDRSNSFLQNKIDNMVFYLRDKL